MPVRRSVKQFRSVAGLGLGMLLSLLTACGSGGSGGGSNPPSPQTSEPLSLRNTVPEGGDACVGTANASVSATFSTDIDESTLHQQSFVVREAGGATVSGLLSYANRTAIFKPSAPLRHNQIYNVSLSDTIRDTRGNAFRGFGWSFTTIETTTSGNYRACWQAVNDSRITGYRLYWGATTPVTPVNANGTRVTTAATAEINPTELGTTNAIVYMAVRSYSDADPGIDSPLSNEVTVVVGQ